MNADVIVIGGGPGGYVAAIKSVINEKKVILIEKDQVGGTCLNRGCIPTKALIHCADVLDTVKGSSACGIKVSDYQIDTKKINDYKNSVVKKLVGGVSYLLNKRGVQVIQGSAAFSGIKELTVTQKDGTKSVLTAESIIIAAGSESARPPIPGLDGKNVITSTEALNVESLPKSLAIIGGGVIGMEIGSTYAKFGVEVTVLEALPHIVPSIDTDVREVLLHTSEKIMTIETGAMVKEIQDADNQKKVVYETQGERRECCAEKVMVCVGRCPNTKKLGLETAGIQVNKRGYIQVNSHYETTAPGVYAIGDVNGQVLLAHAASAQGIYVADRISGKQTGINTKLIPSCIYTKPEIACVGKTEDELKKENIPYNVGKFPLSGNGKALSMGEQEGFVKILTGKNYGEILGAHIVGARATDLIGELALAINAECTAEEIIHTVHPHPTVSEAIFEAAELSFNGQTVHII